MVYVGEMHGFGASVCMVKSLVRDCSKSAQLKMNSGTKTRNIDKP
jgi:hypothetical protein